MLLTDRAGALTVASSGFAGTGLTLLQPLGGEAPVAAGTSAQFTVQLGVDCGIAARGGLRGVVRLVLVPRSGRRHVVTYPVPAEVLAGAVAGACGG